MDFDGTALTELTDDQLEQELVTWAGRVNAGQARVLALIGEVNARGSWSGTGWLSCTHWLTTKLGMAPKTAYEHVRVAHCLRALPLISSEMAAGRLSWTQVRALTRVATESNEAVWIETARHASGAVLAKLARATERAKTASTGRTPPPQLTQSFDEHGGMTITIRVPTEVGTVIMAGVKAALEDLVQERKAEQPSDSPAGESTAETSTATLAEPTLVDAATALAKSYLATRNASAAARDRVGLRVYVDPRTGWSRTVDGELLPPAVTARLTKKPVAVPLPRGQVNLGRLQREASAYQRALLEAIDGAKCAFPDCDRRKNLHAHHVVFFRNGGRTDFNNLVLLCHRHHNLTHDDVYRLELLPDRTLNVLVTRTGTLLRGSRAMSTEVDPHLRFDRDLDPRAAHTLYEGDHIDIDYAVMVLAAL
jgi:5-methylcytosine-specific restriction endonuclease McrA